MILVADESVTVAVIDRLRADGHTVHAVREINPGVPDADVLATAVGAGAVLLTQDKDFGELVFRLGLAHRGVVLIRLGGMDPADRAELVSGLVRDRAVELPDAFTVLGDGGVRIRPGAPP